METTERIEAIERFRQTAYAREFLGKAELDGLCSYLQYLDDSSLKTALDTLEFLDWTSGTTPPRPLARCESGGQSDGSAWDWFNRPLYVPEWPAYADA